MVLILDGNSEHVAHCVFLWKIIQICDFFRFETNALNRSNNQLKLHAWAPISELPSNKSTMIKRSFQEKFLDHNHLEPHRLAMPGYPSSNPIYRVFHIFLRHPVQTSSLLLFKIIRLPEYQCFGFGSCRIDIFFLVKWAWSVKIRIDQQVQSNLDPDPNLYLPPQKKTFHVS